MPLRLHLVLGTAEGTLPTVPGQYLIGRAEDCDLRLEGKTVSRYHAEIVYTGQAVIVRDLGSKNGTFVNAQRVFGPRVVTLHDQISVGSIVLEARELPELSGAKEPPVQSVHEAAMRWRKRGFSDSETLTEADIMAWLGRKTTSALSG